MNSEQIEINFYQFYYYNFYIFISIMIWFLMFISLKIFFFLKESSLDLFRTFLVIFDRSMFVLSHHVTSPIIKHSVFSIE